MTGTMRGRSIRIAAAAMLAALALASTWWRTPVSEGDIGALEAVALAYPEGTESGFRVTGLWDMRTSDIRFGGYSALIFAGDDRLLAFADRGRRLEFGQPGDSDLPASQVDHRPRRGLEQRLWDIESATRNPASGAYWLGYEAEHAIHRFTADHRPNGHVLLETARWPDNSGLESLVRLADGRFLMLPESEARLYLYPADPVEGADAVPFPVEWPEAEFAPTDAAELPDGRVLVLMRRVVAGLPPTFDNLIVVGALPAEGEAFRPEVALWLNRLLPHENYEGMALTPLPDGGAEIWLIADDNFSAFQRTLLARLRWQP
ncbi:esterase-like activity of phytase family protein [Aurantiacibacter sp. MUD11]|uniref:esterase-like activity of phytase family protein n=1 Tax=Aurantiacibacter sp. MUD11 TaxID=3003265 RepID=UPI0022AA563A|nr:esterase-like activity of phytase family protein [Aurantiacibacter sp. MUD11]WAT17133.1 esterase-like activity of phytase family protein [Aurantiacibacter sp. MUD11]